MRIQRAFSSLRPCLFSSFVNSGPSSARLISSSASASAATNNSTSPTDSTSGSDKKRDEILKFVMEKFPNSSTELSMISLQDPVHKFTLLSRVETLIGRKIASVEMNNINIVQDLLDIIDKPEINVLKKRKETVKQQLSRMDLPPNMHWIPSKRDLIAKVMKDEIQKRKLEDIEKSQNKKAKNIVDETKKTKAEG